MLRRGWIVCLFLLGVVGVMPLTANALVKGIYLTQPTVQSASTLRYLIKEAKSTGINTFVVDAAYRNSRFSRNIKLVHDAGIRYVARVVIFPYGGSYGQVHSPAFWQRKQRLIEFAIQNGAKEIQLDYIRYNIKQPRRRSNVDDIHRIIRWFKKQLNGRNVKLQVAVFGETSFGPSLAIGQDVRVFAPTVDVINPMLYPSHYRPYSYHSKRPYDTVYRSVRALNAQFRGGRPFQLIPYIEVRNFRYRSSGGDARNYFYQQIKAVEDGGADGWYAWSARNQYRLLFQVLRQYPVK